jgi:hypothetical protein
MAFASALFESSLLVGTSIQISHKPRLLGCIRTGGIFSTSLGLIPNISVSVCRGERCLLMYLFALFLISLCNGWEGGRAAILVYALWHAFSTWRSIGKSAACASSESVGEVLKPPVIARAPACCTEDNFLMKPTKPLLPPLSFLPCRGVHQTSMLYMMRGSATLTYNFLAPLGVSPHDGLVSLQICKVHFAPLPQTCAS